MLIDKIYVQEFSKIRMLICKFHEFDNFKINIGVCKINLLNFLITFFFRKYPSHFKMSNFDCALQE